MFEYARAVVLMLKARPELNQPVKGRGHAPRIKIATRNPFTKMLKGEKLIPRKEIGGVSWVVPVSLMDAYRMHMLAAGMELNTPAVIDERAAKCALAVLKLSGSPYDDASAAQISEKVKRSLNRKYLWR